MAVWKTIEETKYQISTDGSVKNAKTNRILKQHKINSGYLCTNLSTEGFVKTYPIHRLLAMAFIPNPGFLAQIDHIDRDKLNNNLSNLRWVSKSDNNRNKNLSRLNKTGHRNICRHRNKFLVQIRVFGESNKYIGRFKTIEEAIEARDAFKTAHNIAAYD